MAKIGFNSSAVAPRENNYDLLPMGWYAFIIVDSEIKNISAGKMLKLTYECQAQGFRGRKVWQNLCFEHTNAQTQLIAQQQLKELCDTLGIANLDDTVELHNKPLQARVKIRKSDNPQYPDDTNEITAVKPIGAITGGAAPAAPAANQAPTWGGRPAAPAQAPAAPAPAAQAPAQAPAPAAPAAAPAGNVPPWQRG